MNNNGISDKYWLSVLRPFLLDVLAFVVSFIIGMRLRFGEAWQEALTTYWPGMVAGALVFACSAYIFGLYSRHSHNQSLLNRSLLLAASFAIAGAVMLGTFYLHFSFRIGRGAMLISGSISYVVVLLHHIHLLRQFRNYRERVALIVTSAEDMAEVPLLKTFAARYLNFVGVIHYENYQPGSQAQVLGSVNQLPEIARRERLERVLCTNQSILDPALCKKFCHLRYSGVTVMPLISLFEEMCQCVPVELITPDWLMSASGSPHMIYIKKLKRSLDIIFSISGLLFFWPFLLLGMLAVKLTSPNGPVFYRQRRSGRFGKPFTLIKLRTMKVDAEEGDTAVWARHNDPRVIPGGNFLRRYRVDEIPQLWNVLRGEMSFIGPRPERPEFVEQLRQHIPYYEERLLVQPGITGWAQVNYPYGASIDDAKHKLEYDLYYTKNMSLFLDVFILLDTIRIILHGGLRHPPVKTMPRYRNITNGVRISEQPMPLLNKPVITAANAN